MEQPKIHVAGAKGPVPNAEEFIRQTGILEKQHSVTIQFFRSDRIFGAEHIVSAGEKAIRAMANKTNMSRTLGMEILLYAAAERQTSEALRKLGIYDGIDALGLIIVGKADVGSVLGRLGLKRDDSVLEPAGKDPSVFGIDRNSENIADLVLEKVAVSEVFR